MIILMMTQIVFSQMSMEIYAYSFMAKRTGEINNHINIVKEKKKKETKNISKSHKGHDWAVPVGTKVVASATGIVEKAYFSQSYGYNVLIDHENGMKTRYAHMSKLYVTQGQRVKQEKIIGLSGNTGDSTGPHLHFEMIRKGQFINPLVTLK